MKDLPLLHKGLGVLDSVATVQTNVFVKNQYSMRSKIIIIIIIIIWQDILIFHKNISLNHGNTSLGLWTQLIFGNHWHSVLTHCGSKSPHDNLKGVECGSQCHLHTHMCKKAFCPTGRNIFCLVVLFVSIHILTHGHLFSAIAYCSHPLLCCCKRIVL